MLGLLWNEFTAEEIFMVAESMIYQLFHAFIHPNMHSFVPRQSRSRNTERVSNPNGCTCADLGDVPIKKNIPTGDLDLRVDASYLKHDFQTVNSWCIVHPSRK